MNIPFPILYPRLVDPTWFNADSPCDEDAELTSMEQAHQQWLNSIGQQYMKRPPLGKPDPEPMEEEADSDEEEGNDESDESEESHDEDEEEELRTYSPPRNNNEVDQEFEIHDQNPDPSTPDQSALWPQGRIQPLN
ncbi:anaphase-promoting complex subunit 15-like isoform X2 [Maniola jurtina]|nr:anaphase-promoting complex subunit 15-like isoform X2 [Maniola jurtina]XP_045761747.1 anaphase-promoting complex subunit 15-like isoform X2 [Maniola jurtina]